MTPSLPQPNTGASRTQCDLPAPPAQPAQPASAITLPDDARILVVKLASLGDLLLTAPALRSLRRRYPRARLDVLTTRQAASLLRDSPLVDHVYTLGVAGGAGDAGTGTGWLRAAWWSLVTLARLRATRYDAVALLHHLTLPAGRIKHRALLAAIGARWRAGLENGHGGFLDVRVADQGFGAWHEAEYFLAVAAALGAAPSLAWPLRACAFPSPVRERGNGGVARAHPADGGALRPQFRSPLAGRQTKTHPADGWALRPQLPSPFGGGKCAGRRPSEGGGAPLIAVHPGAGRYSVSRRWPMAKFAAVMRALHASDGALFVVVGGAEEAALRLRLLRALGYPSWVAAMEDVAYAVEMGVNDVGGAPDDPRSLANILRRCDLFIGDDSFPMHMAAAVGTPLVAIFGPSNHRAWGPFLTAQDNEGDAGDAGDADDAGNRRAGARAVIVRRSDLVCSPCLYRGHALGLRDGCAPRPCLNELGAATVVAAARRLLPHMPEARQPRIAQAPDSSTL